MEEQVQPQEWGANLRLLHNRVRVAPFANGAFAQDGTQVAQAARALKDTRFVASLDASGNPGPLHIENPPQGNFGRVNDINDLHAQLGHGFALASAALPNRLVNPNETWTADRTISLGGKTVVVGLTYTYEGTRTRGGREEALIRVAGAARALPGQGKPATASAGGEIIFDLAAGLITFARVDLNLDLEVIPSLGAAPVQATGSVISHLTRSVATIPELSRQIFRTEDQITAADPKGKLQPGYHKIFRVPMKAGRTYVIDMVEKVDPAAKRHAFDPTCVWRTRTASPWPRMTTAAALSMLRSFSSPPSMANTVSSPPPLDRSRSGTLC